FDVLKAQWFNQHYLRNKSDDTLADFLLASLEKQNISCTREKALKIVSIMRERITFPQDLWEQGKFFFKRPEAFDEGVVNKKWNDDAKKVLATFEKSVNGRPALGAAEAKELLDQAAAAENVGTGKILQALRVALTGAGGGPDLMMIMEIIGPQEVAERIAYAL